MKRVRVSPESARVLASYSAFTLREQPLETQKAWVRAFNELVAAHDSMLEEVKRLDASWLLKDFNVLYRVALDVSESDTRPTDECPPPLRNLRAQLERLRSAFTDTEEVRAYLRERDRG